MTATFRDVRAFLGGKSETNINSDNCRDERQRDRNQLFNH